MYTLPHHYRMRSSVHDNVRTVASPCLLQSYCINREQFDFVLDVTKFKTNAGWAEDPMKDVDTKTKSAFTRTFNKQVCASVFCWGW